jgi:muconolactone delta-isomerase
MSSSWGCEVREYLVEFAIDVPTDAPPAEVAREVAGESAAAADLAARGHLLRVWARPARGTVLGLYRAQDRAELDAVLGALPLADWMQVTVDQLDPHPNDPAGGDLPSPLLVPVFRLEASIGEPVELGTFGTDRHRIVALTAGVVTGPVLAGRLVAEGSADRQTILTDGTAVGDIRYTVETDGGELLAVESRSVRHGGAEVLARLARGEDVDPAEYVFRATTRIEVAAGHLDWLNKGVFVTVGARRPTAVIYDTYLVR